MYNVTEVFYHFAIIAWVLIGICLLVGFVLFIIANI